MFARTKQWFAKQRDRHAPVRRRAHPLHEGVRVMDATRHLRGQNLLSRTLVDPPYVMVLDREVDAAVSAGEITPEQAKSGLRAAYESAYGILFLCLLVTDGSGLIVGTSVPQGAWRWK